MSKYKSLIMINPDTGATENYGYIANKRQIGKYDIILTYDENRNLWWIVIRSPLPVRALGFIDSRREVAWDVFINSDEEELTESIEATKGIPEVYGSN